MVVIQDSAAPRFIDEFHQRRWTVLVEGMLLFVLGSVALAVPFVAGIVITTLVGWLLVFAGILGLWTGRSMCGIKGNGWAILSSVVTLTAGAAFLAWPIGGLISLTLLLGDYLTLDGVSTIALALQYRQIKTGYWGWLLANGILDIFLAAAIVILFPGISVWLVGVIVGVDLVFAGISLIAIGSSAKTQVVKLTA
jgi:uncharacterized membrane protein HdeD (DUF308 family)